MNKVKWDTLKDYEKVIYLEGVVYELKLFFAVTVFILIYFITNYEWLFIPMLIVLAFLSEPPYRKSNRKISINNLKNNFDKELAINIIKVTALISVILYVLSKLSEFLI